MFLRRTCVRFVVVNKRNASDELRAFAVETLRLDLKYEDEDYQLLVPLNPPPCEPLHRYGHPPQSDDTPRLLP
jgi:hypothetical protein